MLPILPLPLLPSVRPRQHVGNERTITLRYAQIERIGEDHPVGDTVGTQVARGLSPESMFRNQRDQQYRYRSLLTPADGPR